MKILVLIILAIIIMILVAAVGAGFIYLTWNNGVAPATGARQIDFVTAMWLSAFIATVGGMFKTEVKSS